MLHEPAAQSGKDPAANYKMKLGVKMFSVYAFFYVCFVAINVIDPGLMESTIVFGLNLAVTYGFGLILLALCMALIYNYYCSKREAALEHEADATEVDPGSTAAEPGREGEGG